MIRLDQFASQAAFRGPRFGACLHSSGAGSAPREVGLREQLQASRREAADRLQTVRSLSALLERSTSTLRQAEQRNEALYREALGAVETYRKEAVPGEISLTDPLGFRAVRRENTLDSLRGGLEKQIADPPKPASGR